MSTALAVQESTVRDWFTLTKPGVMSLVVFTAVVGLWLAPGHMHPFMQAVAVLSIAMGSGAGAVLNMWYDRDIDAVMLRTAPRPVASGRIAPESALAFGILLSLASVSLMGLAANWLAAGILAFAIFFYAVVYTQWLKRRTPQNIVIGGAAGAFPPMIGWAAVTGDISIHSTILFLVIFLWTPPHFWALALYRNSDYKRAGVPMLPVTNGIPATTVQMLVYTFLLVGVTLLPYVLHMQGIIYGVVASVLGALFIRHAVGVWRSPDDARAKRMFGFSIVYLFALFMVMVIDRVVQGAML